jgi:hypothetical protein
VSSPDHRRVVLPQGQASRWTPFRAGWAGILVVTLGLRIWMLSSWSWLQDDLLLTSWTTTKSFPEYITTDVAGHLLTGELLMSWTFTKLDPLDYTWPALTIVVFSALVVIGWGLALRRIFGERVHVLLALVVLNLSPGITAVSLWWISCLNVFPMLAGMGFAVWFLARYLMGDQRRGDLIGMNLIYAGSLLMWGKSLLITVPLFFLVFLLGPERLRDATTLAARLLWPTALLSLSYLGVYAWAVAGSSANPVGPYERSVDSATEFVVRGTADTTLPTLIGGPFQTVDASLSAFPATPTALALLLWTAVVALSVIALVFRRRAVLALAMILTYASVSWGLVYFSSRFTGIGAGVLGVPRYSADLFPVVVLGCLYLITSTRGESENLRRPISPAVLAGVRNSRVVYAGVVAVLALTSTVRLWDAVAPSSTKPYMDSLVAEAQALGAADVYDSVVPQELVSAALLPEASRFSNILSPLDLPLSFNGPAEQLLIVNTDGQFRKAAILGGVGSVSPGPDGDCGYAVEDSVPREISLDGEAFDFEWGLELTYFTGEPARIAVTTDRDRVELDLPVGEAGSVARQQMLIEGKISRLTVEKLSGGAGVCITEVRIGNFEATDEVPDQLK